MTKTDYTKKNFNINDHLPEVIKSEYLTNLNDNLFNRFLTKSEFKRNVGIVGVPGNSDSNQIKENNSFRQANQLQAVISATLGTEDYFMSFEDFQTRVERLGIQMDDFATWGQSQHFNWVPPIDIDKLVNYKK